MQVDGRGGAPSRGRVGHIGAIAPKGSDSGWAAPTPDGGISWNADAGLGSATGAGGAGAGKITRQAKEMPAQPAGARRLRQLWVQAPYR